MGKVIWSINVSLDGIADHTVGIGVDDDSFAFFANLLDDTAVVVFGRVTYQLMEVAWPNAHKAPNASKAMLEFADKFNAVPKVVFSRTLDKAEWNNTRLVHEDMVSEVARLKQQSSKDILVDGISLAQELMNHGMIDEYWFVVHPIVVGKGKRLFDNLKDRAILRLVNTKIFKSGVVVLHYEKTGSEI